MELPRVRLETWLLPVAVVGGLATVVIGALVTMASTATPIHPNADAVTSIPAVVDAGQWRSAVEKSRPIVRAAVAQQNVPGISVAVGVGGGLVWAEGFGWANLETRAPITPTTRLRVGHVSKALTSAAAGLLREQGRLHLDDEIQVYVPQYARQTWPVTVRQLMGHTAGVPHYRDTEWGDKPTTPCTRAADGVHRFANEPLLFEPGTRFQYSTYGWVLVSAALEAATSRPFFEFMKAAVFEPLGMTGTAADVISTTMPDRATSYYRGNLGSELTTAVDHTCFAGGGAFVSTPADMVRFGQALMGGRFLQPSTVSLLQTPTTLSSGAATTYGLGWMLESAELAGARTSVVGHASRTLEGASTSFLMFPEHDLVVAVSANISFADMRSVALAIAEVFVGRCRDTLRPCDMP